jgi:hypothetical protein
VQDYTYLVTVDSVEIDGRLVNVDADGEDQWPRHNGEQIPNLAASTPAPTAIATPPP